MLLYWIVVSILWVFIHLVWRIEIIGRENLETVRKGGGWVVAGNHVSNLDPLFIVVCIYDLTRMRVLAKAELFQNGFFGWFLRCMGAVSVDRGKGDTRMLDQVTAECRRGKGVLVFPEGTRSKDGRLGNLKSGAFVIAAAAGADMVPCRILYDTKDGRQHPFCKIRICFGPAIPASELQITDPSRKIAALRRMKNRLAAELETLAEEHYFPAPAFDPRKLAAPAAQSAAAAPQKRLPSGPVEAAAPQDAAPAQPEAAADGADAAAAQADVIAAAPSLTLDVQPIESPRLELSPDTAADAAQTPTPKGE